MTQKEQVLAIYPSAEIQQYVGVWRVRKHKHDIWYGHAYSIDGIWAQAYQFIIAHNFVNDVAAWLMPLGYAPIYKINHPTVEHNEIHYIKDGVRIICVLNSKDIYCYAYVDIIVLQPVISIQSCKFALHDNAELVRVHSAVLNNAQQIIRCNLSYTRRIHNAIKSFYANKLRHILRLANIKLQIKTLLYG
jgi:hypothetical protein